MEQKELNLCEILKGHEGKKFYSPCYGNVKLTDVYVENIVVKSIIGEKRHTLTASGLHPSGIELMLFPSKDQRDWDKWAEENKKVTYEDIEKCLAKQFWCGIENINCTSKKQLDKLHAINKLMNVQKYIEEGWQPNWDNGILAKYYIEIDDNDEINIDSCVCFNSHMVYFSTKANAEKSIEILGEDVIREALSTDW